MSYNTHYERFKELMEKHKIARGVSAMLTMEQRALPYYERLLAIEEAMTKFEVVVECVGHGYANTKYHVLRNTPGLSSKDLAIICDAGNLCFGYRTEGNVICVYTD